MSNTDNGLHEFGTYCIHIKYPPEKSQLWRSGEELQINPTQKKLLVVLVKEAKDNEHGIAAPIETGDLITKVWGTGRPVGKDAVHQVVKRLRKEMGDVEGKYIKSDQGYYLGVPISSKLVELPSDSPDAIQEPPKSAQHALLRLHALRRPQIVITLLVLFGAVLLGVFVLRRPFLVPYNPCSRSVGLVPAPSPEVEVARVDGKGQMYKDKGQVTYHVENLCNGVPLLMVNITPGSFWMGSPEGEPMRDSEGDEVRHEVNIEYTFYIGQYEVTRAQWWAVASRTDLKEELDLALDPSYFRGDDELPVGGINWYEAIEFCKRLTKMTGNLYRLPSETEWEYACRAHTQTPFSFGNKIDPDWANYDWRSPYNKGVKKDESLNHTRKVGTSGLANGFGLYDMHGNVWEFCQDWTNDKQRKDDYNFTPNNGCPRQRRSADDQVIVRGGSWYKPPEQSRSADRGYGKPDVRSSDSGFRVVMEKNVSTSQSLKQRCSPARLSGK